MFFTEQKLAFDGRVTFVGGGDFAQLPSDKLESAKREVEYMSDAALLRAEEELLRNAPALAAAEQELNKPWFATNVVDHRCVNLLACLPAIFVFCRDSS